MGTVMTARMLTRGEAAAAAVSASSLEALRHDAPDDPTRAVDLGEAWSGIELVLAGPATPRTRGLFRRRAPEPVPRGAETRAVTGGTAIGEDGGQGPARLLDPAEVDAVAAALAPLTSEAFADELAPAYEALRALYLRAAAEGASVLLVLS